MPPDEAPVVRLLRFRLGAARFALAAQDVREVVRAVAIAPLPAAPPVVEGVINHRGTIAAVLDIRRRFSLASVPLRADQHFIVATAAPRTVALRVDEADELVTVAADLIEPAQRAAPDAKHVAGIARLPDGVLVIHDLATFLAHDEAVQLDAALDATHVPAAAGAPASGRGP
ncbi:MAG: chemotaxis protein CheW [Gemmatimonadota bacterium]|nr:chemotaxis protein CheW [Gemmatimonadota bacterium]